MAERNPNRTAAEGKQPTIVAIFENPSVREHAIHFCDHLGRQRQPLTPPKIEWWSFASLHDASTARNAAAHAASADIIILSTTCCGDLPAEIKSWIESWIHQRGEREGAFVGLLDHHPAPCEVASLKEIYLRQVARRAGMDYLTHVPPTKAKAMPDSIESYNQRAGQVTSVLDDILHAPPPLTPPI